MSKRAFHEPEAFSELYGQILQSAAELGLSQNDLARKTGVAPETLSRAKTRGGAEFGLIVRLAKAVGLRIALVRDDEAAAAVSRGEFF